MGPRFADDRYAARAHTRTQLSLRTQVFAPNFVRALTIEAEHQNAAATSAFVELLIAHYADSAE